MANLVVSYAREDRAVVEELDKALSSLGHRAWFDSSVHGGEEWWDKILEEIRACDALLVLLSQPSLTSVACDRERQYARALRKPILPVAIEMLTQAIPSDLAVLQIVDYSNPTASSAFALASALASLPPAPPLSDPLPEPPARPLSYMPELLAQVIREETPTQGEQRHILDVLETALRSADTEEQRGAQQVLKRFNSRGDLYADVERRAGSLTQANPPREGSSSTPSRPAAGELRKSSATDSRSAAQQQPPARTYPPAANAADRRASAPASRPPAYQTQLATAAQARPAAYAQSSVAAPRPKKQRSTTATVLIVLGVLFILGFGAMLLFGLFLGTVEVCGYDVYGQYVCE